MRFHLVLILIFSFAYGDADIGEDAKILQICNAKSGQKCFDCMNAHPRCIWLVKEDLPSDVQRCTADFMIHDMNYDGSIIASHTSSSTNLEDEDYRMPENEREAIQIKPQRIKLRLRQNTPQTFQLKYKALRNYPLDIYYLLDQTHSMRKHKEDLQALKDKLAGVLTNLTTDFNIAFGYFSDKIALPYQMMSKKVLANPCLNLQEVSECPLGSNFAHSLNFTDDINLFNEQVSNISFTANLDDLEGGLDAIMQIILCDKQMGWRMHSRKILILATDGLIHVAGDGLLGGVVRKTPDQCLLQLVNGAYVYDGLSYDYPSIEEVYRKLLESKIVLLLAIQSETKAQYYQALNDLLHEVSYLQVLENDADSITKMVTAGYLNVVERVKFNVIDEPSYLTFEPLINCSGILNQSWTCAPINLDEEYVFNVTVTLTEKPTKKSDLFYVEEMHIHQLVTLEIEYPELCTCAEKSDEDDVNGIYECGIYICNRGWTGPRCEKQCTRQMGRYQNDSATCSNQGDFDEGQCACICDRKFTGDFCQYQCPTDKRGRVCSEEGFCEKGNCLCNEGFTGEICECNTDQTPCLTPDKSSICSGRGICQCGKCVCNQNQDAKYSGKYCEHCTGCHSCLYNKPLSEFLNDTLNDSEKYEFTEVDELNSESYNDCLLEYSPNATFYCKVDYQFQINNIISIKYKQTCWSQQLFYYKAGGGIALCCVLILLLPLLAWKVYVMAKDRRDVANFEKAKMNEKFAENSPLYKTPVTEYKNPMTNNS